MSPNDLRLLCTALAFTVVVIRGNSPSENDVARTKDFAGTIEAFCRRAVPDLDTRAHDEIQNFDATIESLKSDLCVKGEANMHKDRATLLQLYTRLHQRYAAFATDDEIADSVLVFLDTEIVHDRRTRENGIS